MLTAVIISALVLVALAVVFAIAVHHDRKIWDEQQEAIDAFRIILNHYLHKYDPDITVWIAKNDMQYCPYAVIRANGHTYSTRAGSDISSMELKAASAAIFFAKKQLLNWKPGNASN